MKHELEFLEELRDDLKREMINRGDNDVIVNCLRTYKLQIENRMYEIQTLAMCVQMSSR